MTESNVNVPALAEVTLVKAVPPPTIPENVFVPVEVTVKACAPLTVFPKVILPDPVVTATVPPRATVPEVAFAEKAEFVVV